MGGSCLAESVLGGVGVEVEEGPVGVGVEGGAGGSLLVGWALASSDGVVA